MKIEAGVPIPSKRYGKWVDIFAKMKDGDSFVVEDRKTADSARQSGRAKGLRMSIRRRENGTYRVWLRGR